MPECLKIVNWRASTRREVADWLKSSQSAERPSHVTLVVRSQLRPVDVYCYLVARFGRPNGFLNHLRRDDSDNWIHWDFNLKSNEVDVHLAGTSRDVHITVGEALNDEEWKELILRMKNDFARVGREKSKVLSGLEKFVVFQNKFVSIAELCADLHEKILDIQPAEPIPKATADRDDLEAYGAAMRLLSERATALYGQCLMLRLLTPIMAEAYINMMILMFCRDAIRDRDADYQAFLRAKIPDRLELLKANCDGFARSVDKSTQAYADFMRVISGRNFALHGNVDPLHEQIEIVYFDGRRPLFSSPGNNVEKFFEHQEAIHKPLEVIAEYEAVHVFLAEIADCLDARTRAFFDQVISDAYPGYEVRKRRVTRILPDHIFTGMLGGLRYDDDLAVTWR